LVQYLRCKVNFGRKVLSCASIKVIAAELEGRKASALFVPKDFTFWKTARNEVKHKDFIVPHLINTSTSAE